jgi:RNA polymerase sigma-70 factor, ECF subfamily
MGEKIMASDIEGLLRRAWETGRRRWPELDLPADVFIHYLTERLPKAGAEIPLETAIENLHLEDLYLACACVKGVPGAVEALEKHFLARLPALLAYLNPPPMTLDEVCQQVRVHLLVPTREAEPTLAEYAGNGPLLSWVRVIATRMLQKQFGPTRERSGENIVAAMEAERAPGQDPESQLFKHRFRHAFRKAMQEAFAALSSDERYLLKLHFIDRLPTTKLGPLFGKDQSTISRWITKAREKVYEETKRRLKERLHLSSKEFESHMEAIKSSFEMRLSQLLNEEDDEDGED